MKLSEHYVQLFETFISQQASKPPESGYGLHSSVHTKIDEIQSVLCCTTRHTKWILKELRNKHWIEWEAVRGRGKSSKLTFLLLPDEVNAQMAKELVLEGKYDLALQQLSNADQAIKEQFHHWLNGQLGYMIEKEGQKEIDVLRYPFYPSILSLDPAHLLSRHEAHMIGHIFDTLLKYDQQQNKIVTHLAHYWEPTRKGKVWTFYLKKGVRFHHGRELTAKDVVQTFQRFREIKKAAHLWQQWTLKKVEAPHRYVVRFTLQKPDYLFPYYLTYPHTSIIPIEVVEKNVGAFGLSPVGTGPFKVMKHDKTMLTLNAFNHYFKGRVQVDRVEILTLPELLQEEGELINYRYDFSEKTHRSEGALKDKSSWKSLVSMENGASYFVHNLEKKGPQQSILFRQALYTALSISQIGTDLGFANYIPAFSFFAEKSKEFPVQRANLEQAQEWLKRSGYNGETIRICSTEIRPKVNLEMEMKWVQKQWSSIGVQSKAEVIPIHQLAKPEFLSQVDIVFAGVTLGHHPIVSLVRTLQMPMAFIYPMLHQSLKDKLNETLNVVKSTTDSDDQMNALIDLENVLIEEHALQFLFHRSHSVQVRSGTALQGVRLNDDGRVDYKSLWFKPRSLRS
ncbi:ABC transporter substrate-binding protein [Bacillus horti]|uniref:MarR-like DNA-binding transcriptional regulator SgrR of sgrS sRNA n=1 Tax=Caldalkalibacillus horti TaxID=77523 RepID=A0ABT9W0W0_9BACI|nr:ABC transporter substrate-binding protein [Bacillus horti]MDQ0166903.1 MarR-like DNA-binding transcriptional regulator SgrR of sgrS sRNA [Bacillus horti]